MTALESYSPLESLLLFQALSVFGTHADAFEKVSESLKNFTALGDAPVDNEHRFEPHSLKNLYIRLLKEDAKQELQKSSEGEDGTPNGDGANNSRKRKIGSPNLRTVEDASQHNHLMPKTVARLYANYQAQIIKEIKADERRYDALNEEAHTLQAEVDNAVFEAVDSQETPKAAVHAGEASQVSNVVPTVHAASKSLENLNNNTVVSGSTEPETNREKTKIDAIINHDEPPAHDTGRYRQSEPQSGDAPSLQAESNEQKSFKNNQNRPAPLIPAASPASRPSSFQHPASGPSVVAQHSPYGLPSTTSLPSSHSPTSTESAFQRHSPESPVLLPPPPGATRPPLPHVGPHSSNQDIAASSRAPGPISPNQTHQNRPDLPQPEQDRLPHTPYEQGYPHFPSHSPYQQQYQYPNQPMQPQTVPLPPPKGGILLQPFQVTPQAPSPSHQFPYSSPANPSTGRQPPKYPVPPGHHTQQSSLVHDQPSHFTTGPRTPAATSSNRDFRQPGITHSPGSTTAWKLSIPASTGRRPLPEEISPVDEEPPFGIGTFRSTTREAGTDNRKPPGMKVGQSQFRPTRGRSRSSATDEMAASLGPGGRRVKQEPTTPMSTAEQDLDPATPKPAKGQFTKRKRGDEEFLAEDISPPASPRRDPNTVVAYKNFDKMTQHVLENITSHKLAGIFANPVKDRDAEGYSSIIRRPQDLKSIRNAIRAGSKAVAQAAADAIQNSPGRDSSSGVAGTVTLPFNEDLVPPKGIVNPAQLECELTRMFANAVMFNPGDEDVVQDTRDMFEDVEQIMSGWRSTEKSADRQESAESAEEGAASIKRRRI